MSLVQKIRKKNAKIHLCTHKKIKIKIKSVRPQTSQALLGKSGKKTSDCKHIKQRATNGIYVIIEIINFTANIKFIKKNERHKSVNPKSHPLLSVQSNTALCVLIWNLEYDYPHLSQRSANSPDRRAQPLRHWIDVEVAHATFMQVLDAIFKPNSSSSTASNKRVKTLRISSQNLINSPSYTQLNLATISSTLKSQE